MLMLVANRTALVEQHYSNDMVAMGMQKRVLFKMQKQMVFEMQKKSPSEPRRDKSDDTAAHHAADAEDGDDEGPDEGDRGVARRVQRLPFLQGLTPQLCKEKVFLQECAYQVTLLFLILF